MIQRLRKLYYQHRYRVHILTRFSLYALAFFFLCLIHWTARNFGRPSLEQILYHLQFGAEGLVDADRSVLLGFAQYCLLLPLLLAWLAMRLESAMRSARSHALSKVLASGHSRLDPLMSRLFWAVDWAIGRKLPLYVLLGSTLYFGVEFSAGAYLRHQFGKDYFAQHYIQPARVQLHPIQPRNLVLIYIESLEASYRSPALFGKNLLASLDQLGGMSIARFRQMPGTHWTMAGMVATQCGVPLKNMSIFDGNIQGEHMQSFMPNALCLSDILHRFGYRNVYMSGDALSFAGKGKFYRDHHYDEIYGRDELKQDVSPERLNYWGLHDDDFLRKVRHKLQQLQQAGQPFNLTISTIDTHGPEGYFSTTCRRLGTVDFAGVVECTARQVAHLVQFIRDSGYLYNTQVVILGDHLAMYNPLLPKLEQLPERSIYNRFISSTPVVANRDTIVHFDLLPTLLDFMGIQVAGGRLALGYSVISQQGVLPDARTYDEMEANLLNRSDTYLRLWQSRRPAHAVR